MDNVLIKAAFQSLGLTFLLSAAVGAGMGLITASPAVGTGTFILITVLQFVLGSFFNTKSAQRDLEAQQALLAQAAEIRIPFDLSCAYCNVVNRVPISLLQDNIFKCTSCNQPNRIFIQFTTTRITQPLVSKVEKGEVDMEGETVRQTTINEPIQITGNPNEPK